MMEEGGGGGGGGGGGEGGGEEKERKKASGICIPQLFKQNNIQCDILHSSCPELDS